MSDGHSSGGWGSGSSSWSGADGYGTSDPYSSSDPYGSSASSGAADPYAASDPYASPAPSASEFAPQFGNDQVGSQQHAHQAAVPYAAPLQDPYGVPHPVGYAVAPPTSASAITGLVLGILSLTFVWGVPGPVGLVFSIIGMRATAPGAQPARGGRGLAIAGLVTSILGTLALLGIIAYIIVMIVFVASMPTDY